MAKGQTPQTQTTKVDLTQEQKDLLGLAMPWLKDFAANPPQGYQGSRVAGFDPLQTQGQNLALGARGSLGQLGQSGADATNFMLSRDFLNPNTNPAFQATIDASTRPIENTLMRSTLPGLRGEAVTAGGFGGSRQGIAEGLASGEASRAIGDTAAKVSTAGYQSGLDAQGRALALLPQTQQSQLLPSLVTSGVGDVRQNMSQAMLSDRVNSFNYDQLMPLLVGQQLASIAGGMPGAGATTTASQPQSNPWMSAFGGASSGFGLGNALFPGLGGLFGSGLGGLLGYFGSR